MLCWNGEVDWVRRRGRRAEGLVGLTGLIS